MKRALKNLLKQNLRRVFELGQRAGVDVLPRHFYSQASHVRALRTTTTWRQPRRMDSVRGHELAQEIAFAEQVCEHEFIEQAISSQVYEAACAENAEAGFG